MLYYVAHLKGGKENMPTEEMKKVIDSINPSWSKDYIIRFLYINLAPFFRRDITYFLASDEQKWQEYTQGFINRGTNIVCSTLADFYVNLYHTFGIEAKKVIANSAKIPLFAVIVEGDNGWFFIDPINDLFPNQYGLKTTEYGKVPHYKTLNSNYPFLITLQDEYLEEIDSDLKIRKPLDDYFDDLHLRMTNRNPVYEHFQLEKGDRLGLFQRKMEFANEHLINLGSINGPLERNRMYLFLERTMFFKGEKRNIKISLNTLTSELTPQIEYTDFATNSSTVFTERKENGRYVLEKAKH